MGRAGVGSASAEAAESAVLRLAAAVEAGTRHPLADAVLREAEARGIALPAITDTRTEPGLGEHLALGAIVLEM